MPHSGRSRDLPPSASGHHALGVTATTKAPGPRGLIGRKGWFGACGLCTRRMIVTRACRGSRATAAQGDQPGGRGREATGADVEVAQRLLEVDVEPIAAGGAALPCRPPQASRRPTPSCRRSPATRVSITKACTPPSQATLTNPTRRSASKAQTQPRLCRSTWLRQSMSRTGWAKPSA